MINSLTTWSRMASAALAMGRTAGQVSEALAASPTVIATRSGMIGKALRSPFEGNYVELGRMVPEKIDALARAGAAVAGGCWSAQTAFLTQAEHLGTMILRGRPPTLSELATLSSRNAAYVLQTMDMIVAVGGGVVAPVHARVTANARRLRDGGKRG